MTRKSLHSRIEGSIFENRIIMQARMEEIALVQLPTGARPVGRRGAKPILIPVKTPFDFVLIKNHAAAFIDAKSTSKKAFAYTDITRHQAQKLDEIEREGMVAGYLVHFRTTDDVVLIPAHRLMELKPRDSLGPDDGVWLGHIDNFKLRGIL